MDSAIKRIDNSVFHDKVDTQKQGYLGIVFMHVRALWYYGVMVFLFTHDITRQLKLSTDQFVLIPYII